MADLHAVLIKLDPLDGAVGIGGGGGQGKGRRCLIGAVVDRRGERGDWTHVGRSGGGAAVERPHLVSAAENNREDPDLSARLKSSGLAPALSQRREFVPGADRNGNDRGIVILIAVERGVGAVRIVVDVFKYGLHRLREESRK